MSLLRSTGVRLALLGLLFVLAAAPLLLTRQILADADAAEARSEELGSLTLAEPVAIPASRSQAFTARRIPEELVATPAFRRLAARLDALTPTLPAESCLVVAVDRQPLVLHNPNGPLIPASVMKILTAATIYEFAEPDERFVTRLVTDADVVDGVVQGDVWLVGGGDPLLATSEYHDAAEIPFLHTEVELLAASLAEQGVTGIAGRVIGDDSRYDRDRSVGTWPSRYLEQNQAGPLTALSINDGFQGVGAGIRRTSDPAANSASLFDDVLEAAGFTVAGSPTSGTAPENPTVLAELSSPRLEDVVGQMLQRSDNNTAELLLKEIGLRASGEGTTAAGVAAIEEVITTRDLDVELDFDLYRFTDGSGLDRGNLLSCLLVQQVLAAEGAESPLTRQLAVAGESGTLTNRFEGAGVDGRLFGKTGSLNNVRTLAGLLDTDLGTITFAQLMNGLPLQSEEGPIRQNELATALGTFPEGPDPATLAPAGN